MSFTKILVFNVNWLGDILFSFPALLALKNHYPESHLACIVPPQYKTLFQHQSCINEVIALSDRTLLDKYRLIRRLRKEKWDLGFLFHRSKTRARILKWSGVAKLLGDHSIIKKNNHKMEIFKDLLGQEGISNIPSYYEYKVVPKNISIPKPYIVFHPGSNWKPKQWPTQHFAILGEKLQKHFDVSIVITGLKKDKALALKIRSNLPNKIFNLTGETSLSDLVNVFHQSSLVVAGDTGPMHLAAASEAKVLALYGPSSPLLNGPKGKGEYKIIWKNPGCKTYPCTDSSCSHDTCLQNLSPDQVFSTIQDWNIL